MIEIGSLCSSGPQSGSHCTSTTHVILWGLKEGVGKLSPDVDHQNKFKESSVLGTMQGSVKKGLNGREKKELVIGYALEEFYSRCLGKILLHS